MNTKTVVHVDNLQKRFGSHEVLKGVSFSLSKGETLALLGRNGAGKTTIIRTMMGLLQKDEGTIQIAGFDPQQYSLEVRKRVGYLAEDQQMYGWMTIDQLVRFVAAFYPSWNHDMAQRLLVEYELRSQQKVKHLSKGQNIRLGLLLALAQNAELMILDDPALALDPIMRKEFNKNLVAHLQESKSTLIYSSHLLSEVEAVADRIAILHGGRIVKFADVETLRDEVKRVIMPQSGFEVIANRLTILDLAQSGGEVDMVIDHAESAINLFAEWDIQPHVVSLNLEEIFEAFVIGSRPEAFIESVTEGNLK